MSRVRDAMIPDPLFRPALEAARKLGGIEMAHA